MKNILLKLWELQDSERTTFYQQRYFGPICNLKKKSSQILHRYILLFLLDR